MVVFPISVSLPQSLRRAISEDFQTLNSRARGCSLVVCLPALIVACLLSASAFAQSDSNPKWDAFIGYQYQQADGDNVPTAGSNPDSPGVFTFPDMSKGFGGALAFHFDPHWGIETDFGYNWTQGASVFTASAGPRFIVRTDSFAFFMHALPSYNRVS